MRYSLRQLLGLVTATAIIVSVIVLLRCSRKATVANISRITERGGEVTLEATHAWYSFFTPQNVLEVDLSNASLDQSVIDSAIALRPSDRFVLSAISDDSILDLSKLKEIVELKSIELLSANQLCNVGCGIKSLAIRDSVDRGNADGGVLSPAHETHLRSLVNLLQLEICIDGSELPVLTSLRNLEILNLQGSALHNCDLSGIAKLPRLTTLVLSNTGVSDEAVSELEKCSTLKELSLSCTKITASSLDHLVRLPQLEVLAIEGTEVKSIDFVHPWPRLRELHLDNSQLAGESEDMVTGRIGRVKIRIWRRPK